MAKGTAKTSNVFARVEPEIKAQAEQILEQLGIPLSGAISMFMRQIVMQRGIPFAVTLPDARPVFAGALTKEQLDAELAKGMADLEHGKLLSAEEAEAEMERFYGV